MTSIHTKGVLPHFCPSKCSSFPLPQSLTSLQMSAAYCSGLAGRPDTCIIHTGPVLQRTTIGGLHTPNISKFQWLYDNDVHTYMYV
jgi:hypothetical protein